MNESIETTAKELKKEYQREYMKEWRKANKDKLKTYQDRYWEKKAREMLDNN